MTRIKISCFLFVFFITPLSPTLAFGKDKQRDKPADVVRVIDFGVKANSFENASPAITKAIEFCRGKRNVILQLPGGRIDLWPVGAHKHELYISNATEDDTLSKVKNIGFCLDSLEGVTIEGNATLVVLHGKMVSFAFLNSTNITLKNVRFDYERPTMSEMTILSVDSVSAEVMIHPDSKYYIDEEGRIRFYGEGWQSNYFHTICVSPEKNTMIYSSFKPFLESKAVSKEPMHIKFAGNFSGVNFHAGDILTIRDPYRDNAGGFISRSKNSKIENVAMQYMHGLGIVSQFSENITLLKVRVVPAENSGRIISSFADCFHFSGCRGKILIDSCFTSGSHDDPINVHGTHLKITSISNGNKMTVRFMHHQTYGFEAFFPGDSISFVDPSTLVSSGNAIVKMAVLTSKREMEIELDGKLPKGAKVGDCIENITWTPELTVRNSRFERTNTRGILVTTRRKVLIENNIFYRTGMHAILIADDAAGWYESGPVQDITIRNNRFEDCAYNSTPDNYIIAIAPENHELKKGFSVHKNIRIEDNDFIVFDYPLLTARSTSNLSFSNNRVNFSGFLPSSPLPKPQFKLTACLKTSITNCTYPPSWSPVVELQQMDKRELRTDIRVINAKPN